MKFKLIPLFVLFNAPLQSFTTNEANIWLAAKIGSSIVAGMPFIKKAHNSLKGFNQASLEEAKNYRSDASEIVNEFIKDTIKPLDLNDFDIIVKINTNQPDETGGYFYDQKTHRYIGLITLHRSNEELENIIQQAPHNENFRHQLYDLIGAIQHEASHIKHKDQFSNNIIAPFLAPFITHAILEIPLLYVAHKFSNASYVVKSGLLLSALIAKYSVNTLLIDAYKRHAEQRADELIQDNSDVLQAQIDYHRKAAERQKQSFGLAMKDIFRAYKEGCISLFDAIYWWKTTLGLVYCDWLVDHPADQKRADRFQQRLDALKLKTI